MISRECCFNCQPRAILLLLEHQREVTILFNSQNFQIFVDKKKRLQMISKNILVDISALGAHSWLLTRMRSFHRNVDQHCPAVPRNFKTLGQSRQASYSHNQSSLVSCFFICQIRSKKANIVQASHLT